MPTPRKAPARATHVALLRGLNVGGKNRLGMADLGACFEEAGAEAVRTLIQSGNVTFRASAAVAAALPGAVARALEERHGVRSPVIVRTVAELRAVTRANPFLRAGLAPDTLHCAFLSARPGAAAVASLEPDRSPPDAFVVRGEEVYLHLPGGMGRTRLGNAWLDARLGVVSTVRNWRTVLALLALAEGRGEVGGAGERPIRPRRAGGAAR